MSFRTSGLVLAALVVAVLAGCSLLSPGYVERNAELTTALHQAEVERDVALGDAKAAGAAAAASVKAATQAAAGDVAAQAAATAKATADLQLMLASIATLTDVLKTEADARAKVVQNDVASAGESVGTVGKITTGDGVLGLLGAAGVILGAWAKSKADGVAAAPSRAQPQVNELYDNYVAMKADLARLQGQMAPVPGVAELKSGVAV